MHRAWHFWCFYVFDRQPTAARDCGAATKQPTQPNIGLPTNNSIIEIKLSKLPIGGNYEMQAQTYEQHIIQIDQPTTFYLMSDGFQDQFGGEKNRKFMIRQLKEILANIYCCDMAEQATILHQKIQYWRVNLEQTDDITLMGIYVDFDSI